MNINPYKVHVIVDPNFGDRLRDLPLGEPVWIVDTDINRLSYNAVAKKRNSDDYLNGPTIFKVDLRTTSQDWLISELETIDLHHGEMSHDPPWSVINVIGTEWTEKIQSELTRFGFGHHQGTDEGFLSTKGSSSPRLKG